MPVVQHAKKSSLIFQDRPVVSIFFFFFFFYMSAAYRFRSSTF